MPSLTQEVPFTEPVKDSVPKVDNAVAVGEDLEFQRRWWKFERIIWSFFLLVLLCDALGLFGRGWLSKARASTPDGTLDVKYERIERASTPSVMTIQLGQPAIQDGAARLFVSQSIIKELGAQRIAPQPENSTIGGGGITYTFPASQVPATVQLALEPSFPGLHHFVINVPGSAPVKGTVVVVP